MTDPLLRWARRSRGGRTVLGPTVLFLGLLLVYSVLAPAYRAPDEPHHFDLVREWSFDGNYHAIDRQISQDIISSLPWVRFGRDSRHLEQGDAVPRGERPALDDQQRDVESDQFNQISRHPPLYSVLLGSELALLDAVEPGPRWSFDKELAIVRLLTVLLMAPLPFLIARASRTIGLPERAGFIAALVPSGIPQVTHIGSVVNNDNLLTVLSGIAVLLTAFVLAGRRGPLLNLSVGATLGAALMTKASAPVIFVGIGLGYLVAWWQHRPGRRRMLRDSLQVGLPAAVVGGWWYVWVFLEYGALRPKGQEFLPDAPPSFVPDAWMWFSRFRRSMPHRTIGNFGWFDVRVDQLWTTAALVFLGIGIVSAFVVGFTRRRSPTSFRPSTATVLVLPFVVALAAVAQNSYRGYVEKAAFPAMQGRYLFVALPFLAVAIGAGYGSLRGWFSRGALAVCVVWVGLMQLEGTTTMLSFYWGPPGGSLRDQVAAMVTWSPWPTGVTVGFALVAVVGGALVVLSSVFLMRDDEEEGHDVDAPGPDAPDPYTVGAC